jgi:hypothetical protein
MKPEDTHVGLVRVSLGHGGIDVCLAHTCATKGRSNNIVVRRQIGRVASLPAEHVDVVALLHVYDITWHGCGLCISFGILALGDSDCLGRDRCRAHKDILSVDNRTNAGDSAEQISLKIRFQCNIELTR